MSWAARAVVWATRLPTRLSETAIPVRWRSKGKLVAYRVMRDNVDVVACGLGEPWMYGL